MVNDYGPHHFTAVIGLMTVSMIVGMVSMSQQQQDFGQYIEQNPDWMQCEDISKEVTYVYNGSIDDYDEKIGHGDLYAMASNEHGEGVFLLSSKYIMLKNVSEIKFTYQDKLQVECEDGNLILDPYPTSSKVTSVEFENGTIKRDFQ